MRRLISHGTPRSVRAGEVLVDLGDREIPIFVVTLGELEIVRPSFTQETLLRVIGPGRCTGEINTLSGRRAFARVRARQDSEVVQIARESLLALVQTDAELSEILMRAFILRSTARDARCQALTCAYRTTEPETVGLVKTSPLHSLTLAKGRTHGPNLR